MKGTKFGCGMALCGACTVHINGEPARSCSTLLPAVEGKKITPIEGLSSKGLHPVQKAWIELDVPQTSAALSDTLVVGFSIPVLSKTPATMTSMDG